MSGDAATAKDAEEVKEDPVPQKTIAQIMADDPSQGREFMRTILSLPQSRDAIADLIEKAKSTDDPVQWFGGGQDANTADDAEMPEGAQRLSEATNVVTEAAKRLKK